MKLQRALPVLAITGALVCAASKSVLDGVYTTAQAERGRAIYADQCYECHGHDLEGKYESAPLAGDEFLSNWVGQNLLTLSDRIRTTMSGDEPGNMGGRVPPPLTREQTADLVAFLLWFNHYPPGGTELSTKPELLGGIRIDAPPATR